MTVPNPPPPPPLSTASSAATKTVSPNGQIVCDGDSCVYISPQKTMPSAITSTDPAKLFQSSLPWSSLKCIAAGQNSPSIAKPTTKLTALFVSRAACGLCSEFVCNQLPFLFQQVSSPADLSLIFCSLDSDPAIAFGKAKTMHDAIAGQSTIDRASVDGCTLFFDDVTSASHEAYGRLRKSMPDVDLSQSYLPFLMVLETETGKPVTAEGVMAMRRDSTKCLALWMRKEAAGNNKVVSGPLGGRVSWVELVGGSELAAAKLRSIVMLIAVGQEAYGSSSSESVNAIVQFFSAAAADAAAQVSLIMVPVGGNKQVEEWGSAMSARLSSTQLDIHVHGSSGVLDALGMDAGTAKMLGYDVRVFCRESGASVPAFKAFTAIIEQDLEPQEWVDAVNGGKFV